MIEDSVHGAIKITSEEYVLLQTPFLRRLHEIKQLGLAYLVFPTATHSRLEHSLGATYLMHRIVSRIISKAEEDSVLCEALTLNCTPRVLQKFLEVSRLAALLHDSGHLAFSHASEEALVHIMKDCWSGERLPKACKVVEAIAREAESLSLNTKIHEAYTTYFVKKLAEVVKEESEETSIKLIAALNAIKPFGLSRPEQIWESLGLKKEALQLISKLLSNEIYDVDRVDYLVRDALYTGVVYGYIDLDRLIEGLDVTVKNGEPDVIITPKAVQSIEDMFDARFKMYRSVYFHHKLLAIQLAVSRTLELIFEEWENLSPQIYEKIGDPTTLMTPSKLAELIAEGFVYMDDNEVMYLIKLAATRGSKVLRRWARSLLHERRLLPVSLIKRTEEFLIGGALSSLDISEYLANLDLEKIAEDSVYRVVREVGLNENHVKAYSSVRKIVNSEALKSLELTHYLRAVSRAASTPIVQVYVFSDDEEVHKTLYNERWLLRQRYRETLFSELLNFIRR
ncbi:MAG: HD domain-containing protein [Acidilobaceae archaeon]